MLEIVVFQLLTLYNFKFNKCFILNLIYKSYIYSFYYYYY